jgi:tetratricopeptide (TPR) repeat protein
MVSSGREGFRVQRLRNIGVVGASCALSMSLVACSRSAQSYVDRGDAAFAKGDLAGAVLDYRNAVQKDPVLGSARLKLAEAYVQQGDGSAALAEFVRAADLLPKDISAQLKAATLLGLAGRFEDARARADKALAIEPRNVDALVLRANALAGLTDLDGALAQMQEALRLDPRADIQTNLGSIQAAKGDLSAAEASFRQAVATDPKSVAAQVAFGQFLWRTGKATDAEASFKMALRLDGSNLLAHRALALFYLQSGRAAEAEPHLKQVAQATKSAAAVLGLADYYVGTKRPADAKAVLEELSKDQQYWALAKARIADVLFGEGKRQEALATVGEVVSKAPTLGAARVVRGRLLLADGKLDAALHDAQTAVAQDTKAVDARFLLARVHEARRDLNAAAAAYAEVLKQNPRAAGAQLRLAMVEMQRNALPAATQFAEQAAEAQPNNIGAQLVLARTLLARGDLDRASALTSRLIVEHPTVAQVHNQAGLMALARKDRVGARSALERALALNAALVEPLMTLVSMDIEDGKVAQARGRVTSRLDTAPSSSAILALAGRTWASTGDLPAAASYLKRSIEADASNLEAYSTLAQVYLAQKNPDAAVAEFDRLAARQPGSIGPQTVAALIRQAQGRDADARARLERLVEADPRAAVASNNLAWMYASRGEQLDRALQLAQSAKAEIPDHPEVNDTLAFVYLKKQLPALAIPALKLAIDKEPGNPSFHYHLALAYTQIGEKAAARQALEQALKLKSDFDGASDARQLLRTLG